MSPGSKILASGVVLLALGGCGRQETAKTPIASVDGEVLALEDIVSRFDTTHSPSEAQIQEFIQRWILNELLYREAVRRGLDRREGVTRAVHEVRKQLAINALLDDEVYRTDTAGVGEEHVREYFEAHRDEFQLPSDVALVSMVVFADRDAANTFRTRVVQGTPWTVARRQIVADPVVGESVIAAMDSVYHTESTLVPAEVWRVAAA
ncbi:MAG: peptidylprolyl isomerase, partial [Bacteroidota bacterium]